MMILFFLDVFIAYMNNNNKKKEYIFSIIKVQRAQ